MHIGFKSVKHQGWFNRKHHPTRELNPYPTYSEAFNQYRAGENAAAMGTHWDQPRSKRGYKRQDGRQV